MMSKTIWVLATAALVACAANAQNAPYKKEGANYSEWAKGKFSEVVTVTNAKRIIYVAGVGSEDENATGDARILYKDDFYKQCMYAWDKIKRILEKQDASLADVAKVTTYVTDIRHLRDAFKCRADTFGTTPQPAGTLVQVTALAWPGMMIEVDAIATSGK